MLERFHGIRGLARSHRDLTVLECCAVPVGAGKPAKKPTRYQAMSRSSRRRILPTGVIGNDSRSTMCLGTL
ncbi:hypothetical protein DBB42_20025 [Pseudomonas plecoglossicida]|uniref:Uncharacterized protein n=1 Tax=Pseudomonas plecoglossicida TaxID=70775 RepID=A0A2R7UGF3_PSEDL|nr:hypothetical protein DBB42_20025 [Pseudomonas plecoglossicida]